MTKLFFIGCSYDSDYGHHAILENELGQSFLVPWLTSVQGDEQRGVYKIKGWDDGAIEVIDIRAFR